MTSLLDNVRVLLELHPRESGFEPWGVWLRRARGLKLITENERQRYLSIPSATWTRLESELFAKKADQ
jgi:hypothetical protein